MPKSKISFARRILKKITRHSILPATLHQKGRIAQIEKAFDAFWGLNDSPIYFKKPRTFSTFGFRTSISLWTYYFSTMKDIVSLRNLYQLHPFKAQSQDATFLCGMHFQRRHPQKPKTKRVLIVYNGNGEIFRMGASSWLFKILLEIECDYDVVMFDPRECGKSTGWANAKGLIDDGETIYQYVKNTLGFHEDFIDLYGFSLGGAISTLVKAHHPDTQGFLISNRSFQTLDEAVTGLFHGLWAPLALLLSRLTSFMARKSGWILDPFASMKTITSPRLIICHENDPIVHHSASMLFALINHDLHHECHIMYLHQKNPYQKIRNHHVQPLEDYLDQDQKPAIDTLIKFILLHSAFHP